MSAKCIYTQGMYVRRIIAGFYKLKLYGGKKMLNRLFIDGRWNDPAYRERTWLRTWWRRLWRRA